MRVSSSGPTPAEVMLPEFDPRRRMWPPPGDAILQGVDDVWTFALRARERASERRHPDWARQLDALAGRRLSSDLRGVARMLGTSYPYLQASFPLRFAQIRAARAQHLSPEKADARERARAALKRAIAAGGAVTGFQAGRWARMTEPSLSDHCPELYRRLRKLVASRVVSYNPEFVRRGSEVLDAAMGVPRGLTAAEVARSLGATPSILVCACPEAYRKLVNLRKEERLAHRARIRAGLKAELARSAPRGGSRLARELGVHLCELQREADLFSRLMAKRRLLEAERSREAECRKAVLKAVDAERDAQRRALIERLDAALRAELLRPSPRSPRAIAVLHGVDSWFARRYCRAVYSFLRDARAERSRSSEDRTT